VENLTAKVLYLKINKFCDLISYEGEFQEDLPHGKGRE